MTTEPTKRTTPVGTAGAGGTRRRRPRRYRWPMFSVSKLLVAALLATGLVGSSLIGVNAAAGAALDAAAVPADRTATSEPVPELAAGRAPGAVPGPDDAVGQRFEGTGRARAAVGTLNVVLPSGRPVSCTASVVNSSSRSVVLTAAHCVIVPPRGPDAAAGGRPGFVREATFTPGRRGERGPFGAWPVRRMWVPTAFQRDGNPDFDVAFLALDPLQGRRIQDVTGALGVRFARDEQVPPLRRVTTLGYPVNRDGGLLPHVCTSSRPLVRPTGLPGQLGMACAMTGGASGGPWMADSAPGGDGPVVAVNSRLPIPQNRHRLGGAPLLASSRVLFDNANLGR